MGERVVIAGGSGFVGRHLVDRLRQLGHEVRCGTRDPQRASAVRPGFDWVALDVDDEATLRTAFAGSTALVYLVHRMRDAHGDALADTEAAAAERVARCAHDAGMRRIVYLGGPAPEGTDSEHLQARAITGNILRSGPVSTIELRAPMIVGAGSESWIIVRDLALRLPVMVLPSWLRTRSQPIWIGDVTAALAHAVTDDRVGSAWFDLPGPDTLSAEEVLVRIAAHAGIRPAMIRVPVLTPALSSHWIRLVTRADFAIARQLVDGLTVDLVTEGPGYFAHMPGHTRVSFDDAVGRALAAEAALTGMGRAWERFARRVARRA